jgi:hypothetical protein
MWKMNGECVDHILLHCNVAYAIWSVIFDRFGMSWIMFRCVIDLYIIGGPLVGKERCGVKNGAYVPLLVFMEGKEW